MRTAAATVEIAFQLRVTVRGQDGWNSAGPVRSGRDLRRPGGQVPERDPGRASGVVHDVRDVRPERVRRPDNGQPNGVRVRLQETRPVQDGSPADGSRAGRRVPAVGVHRRRGRAAPAVRAVDLRGVPIVCGRGRILRVGRSADRPSRAVRVRWVLRRCRRAQKLT